MTDAPRRLTADDLDTARENRRMIDAVKAGAKIDIRCEDDSGEIWLVHDDTSANRAFRDALVADCEATLRAMGLTP